MVITESELNKSVKAEKSDCSKALNVNDYFHFNNHFLSEPRSQLSQYTQLSHCRRYLFIHSMVSVNRNIVGYSVLVITVVVVFVSYFHNYCDFVRTLWSHYWLVQGQVLVLYALLFLEQYSIILSLFHYK